LKISGFHGETMFILQKRQLKMTLFRTILSASFIAVFLFNSGLCSAQGISVTRFCDIYAESAPLRVEKIIHLFKLPYRPAEQLIGTSNCPGGESFYLKTACVGPHRVAILTLSNPNAKTESANATRLFHLYKTPGSDANLTPCQPVVE
jgi:hypothetical protein